MYDSIRCYYLTIINLEIFQQLKRQVNQQYNQQRRKDFHVIINEKLNRDTGELTYTATITGHSISFIQYHSATATLIFELSIPQYLFGNNIELIQEQQIEQFYKQLQQDMNQLLRINLDIEEVRVSRLHVSHNLNIKDSGYKMVEWLKFISQQEIPRKPHKSIYYYQGRLTGCVFKANEESQARLTFYDKQAEMKKKHRYKNVDKAKDILRIEVKTTKRERNHFSCRMIDLLNKEFFSFIMNKYEVNELLRAKYEEKEQGIPYFALMDNENYKVYQLERVLGFNRIQDDLEDDVQTIYEPKTYKNRQQDVKKFFQFVRKSKEPKNVIQIDY